MTDRTAIDTIKGYFYQFDYSIANLMELKQDTDTIVVEGIEDLDVNTATEETAIQCKYYAKSEYNHSVIAKPIRLMLDHYNEVKKGTKRRVQYKLYGFYKSGQSKLKVPIDLIFLKNNLLTYKEKNIQRFHHNELGLNDNELEDFLSLLTIDIAATDYQTQLSNIFKMLMKQFSCNAFEAENFYYNNAIKVIKDIAVKSDEKNRKISKVDFLSKINYKSVLFNEWFIKFKGENKFYSELRNQYFTFLNISPFERFFIIDIPNSNYMRSELKELLFVISKKWSKLSSRETHQFCPYVYLHNINQKELLVLKNELFSEGFKFIDGFNYDGATFDPKSISDSSNKSNQIKLKILNKLEYIDLTLSEISKTKEIYQFYLSSEFYTNLTPSIKHIKIQFTKLTNIKKII